MKHLFPLLFSLLSAWMLSSCGGQAVHITVTNDLDFAREEVVALNNGYIRLTLHAAPGEEVVVRDMLWRQQPYQLTPDSSDLLMAVSVRKRGVKHFWIRKGRPGHFKARAGAVQRAEDGSLTWGNDLVSFRTDGAGVVLDGGLPAAVYDASPYAYGKLWTSGGFATYEVLEQGPVRLSFRLACHPFAVADSLKAMSEWVVTLDAGARLARFEHTFTGAELDKLTAGFGLLRDSACEYAQEKADAYVAAWADAPSAQGIAAAAVILPPQEKITRYYHRRNGVSQLDISKRWLLPDLDIVNSDGRQLILTPCPDSDDALVCYFGGASGFSGRDAWLDYVRNHTAAQMSPLHIGWKK